MNQSIWRRLSSDGIGYFFVIFAISLRNWLLRHFGETTFEQLYFHLQFGLGNILSAEQSLTWSFLNECIFNSLAIVIVLLGLKELVLRFDLLGRLSRVLRAEQIYSLLPRLFSAGRRTALLWAMGCVVILQAISAPQLVKVAFGDSASDSASSFSQNYKPPATLLLSAKPQLGTNPKQKAESREARQPKNLVLIYLESFEQGLRSKERYGRNLLEPLDTLEVPHRQFKRFWQMEGTHWSIAGMVASQCGIPLRPPAFGQNLFGQKVSEFLPGAVCLGDILKANGYHNTVLAGMDLEFAGVGKFYSQHGYDEVLDLKDWHDQDAQQLDSWGGSMHDDQLLEKAKTKLDQLQEGDKPFNLTIVSVDTHTPGYISPDCLEDGCRSLLDVYKFTAKITADFIRYADEQGYLEDTRIVVLGDHLSMDQGIRARDDGSPESIYNLFVGDKESLPTKNRDDISHFDFLPTMLRFMDFEFEGDRLGLGIAALAPLRNEERVKTKADYAREQRTPMTSAKDYVALFYSPAKAAKPRPRQSRAP